MRALLTSGLAGFVFALGLGVSGMTQADKVIGFLNLADNWDPSLALVMAGAIGVHLVLYRWIVRRPSPLFGEHFGIPTRTDIDPKLVSGAALFGVGWAIGGYCPGPGLVSAASGAPHALTFAGALTAGMVLYHVAEARLQRSTIAHTPAPTPQLTPERSPLG
ncbi:MAG TPA: YeeE/YedE family protein [Deltaproteobacteria bacterium]|nr:YeeE/YedE family protein [Deltaproteobacteria bacterium]